MKTLMISLALFSASSILYSQSSIVYDVGTELIVQAGADICADKIVTHGTRSGSGTQCNAFVLIEMTKTTEPLVFSLMQNYPNPFNPATTISFSLPAKSFVSLKVYDVIGREVATIASEEMIAGSYIRQWVADGYPSGVYFYRLEAGAYTETKRLTLIK